MSRSSLRSHEGTLAIVRSRQEPWERKGSHTTAALKRSKFGGSIPGSDAYGRQPRLEALFRRCQQARYRKLEKTKWTQPSPGGWHISVHDDEWSANATWTKADMHVLRGRTAKQQSFKGLDGEVVENTHAGRAYANSVWGALLSALESARIRLEGGKPFVS